MLKQLIAGTIGLASAGAIATQVANDPQQAKEQVSVGPAPAAPGAAGSPATCFEFAHASTFKTVDGDTIRLTVAGAGDFEIDLSGPQCMALDSAKGLAIQSAPIPRICTGPQGTERSVKFAVEGSDPIRCVISDVRTAPSPRKS